MATKKPGRSKPYRNVLADLNERSPVLATRYWVYEYTPSRDDEYGSWVSAKSSHPLSPYYDTKEEAQDWIESYDPTPGTEFRIGVANLRRYVEERWGI